MGNYLRRLLHDIAAEVIAGLVLMAIVFLAMTLWGSLRSPDVAPIITFGLVSAAAVGVIYLVWRVLVRLSKQPTSQQVKTQALSPSSQAGRIWTEEDEKLLLPLLADYKNQLANWRSHVTLTLIKIDCRNVGQSSPHVLLEFEVQNYLLVPLKLTKVLNSEGTVDVHSLPQLPQYIEKEVSKYSSGTFTIRLDIGPDIQTALILEGSKDQPRALLWLFKGEWYAEVYGREQIAWGKSYEANLAAVPNVPHHF